MSRILKAYETRFRWLLEQVHARKLTKGVEALVNKARRVSACGRLPLADSLTRVYEELSLRKPFRKPQPQPPPDLFFCDAGLGGLARWLRAAGYDSLWQAGIDDDLLLHETRARGATLLTTDSMLMERKLLRDRIIPSLWLPPILGIPKQLRLVFREFGLKPRTPRCMSCGGELVRGDKVSLAERIPPRTFRWLNEYFVCNRCGKLFWHGTHWRRIVGSLEAASRADG